MVQTYNRPGPFSQVKVSDDARGIVERYSNVDIEEKGYRAWIHCPFHSDRNRSMSSRRGDNQWKCWAGSCNTVCSAVDLIAQITGKQPLEVALEIVNGGSFTVNRNIPERKPVPPPNPELNSAVLAYTHCQLPREFCGCGYHKQLGCTARENYERGQVIEALKYMKARGVDPRCSNLLAMGVGSCSTNALTRFLKSRGFSEETQGWDKIFFPPNEEKGWGPSFRFRGYLIFGEPRGKGKVDWLCGRSYKPDAKLPHNHQAGKPQNLALGANSLPASDYTALVTEGTIDYALARQWGYHAVCLNGASNVTTEEQRRDADKMARALSCAELVVAAMDADEAGNYALQCLKTLMGDRIRTLTLPEGVKDIGDLGKLPDGEDQFASAFFDALAQRPI